MYKILISLTLATMSGEIDKFMGELMPMAIISGASVKSNSCSTTIFEKTETKCFCNDRKDLPMIRATKVKYNLTLNFASIVVNSREEAIAALQTNNCSCGGEDTWRSVFRVLNDNYIVQYERPIGQYRRTHENLIVFFRKKIASKDDLERVIQASGELTNGKHYDILCNDFSS